MKVLIAEDCANSREALAGFFRSQGHLVAEAQDGVQAGECLRADVFDAVIIHLNLPRGTPSEIARNAWAVNPAAVLVVVTAFGDGFKQVSRSPESNAFLVQKPFRAGQLMRLIQEARLNKPLKSFLSFEKIDIRRPLMQYGAHQTDLDPKL